MGATLQVERLDPGGAPAAGELFVASHADYPGFAYMFPDPAVRARALLPFMVASARDAARHGHALVAADMDGMLGVALWMPPGSFPPSPGRMARMIPGFVRTGLAAPRSFVRYLKVGAALSAAHPPGDSWYLQAMGVHPRAQRRGVGTRLVEPALARADDAKLQCYLQTSDPANIAFYERFGFEVIQPAIETVPGGHPYIGMLRPASPAD